MFSKPLKTLLTSALFLTLVTSTSVSATIVVFDTSQGEIKVNLFDQSTPKTVANFLAYVNNGDYTNTVIHRSIPNFITQGGGFRFEGDFPLVATSTNDPVINEPVWSNRRGTIAMAKIGGQPDSATNQWFFNLADNSANLDVQNGGFTVFGQIIDNDIDVVDSIASITTCDEIPMPEYDCANRGTPGVENFVTIHNITIIDSSESTASDLNPVENTLVVIPSEPAPSDSGGGSFTWFGIVILGLMSLIRRKTIKCQ